MRTGLVFADRGVELDRLPGSSKHPPSERIRAGGAVGRKGLRSALVSLLLHCLPAGLLPGTLPPTTISSR